MILGEGGIGPEDPRELARRALLEVDLDGSPLRGKPLPRRFRAGFSPSFEQLVASLGGPLPYMVRLREIEGETERHRELLAERWRHLAEKAGGDSERFARLWRHTAERWSFYTVNDLIDRHNRYYPEEARLPMDPRTQDFVLINGEHYERHPLDAAWILERFPPDLDAALEAQAA
jgi:hypothetical protein